MTDRKEQVINELLKSIIFAHDFKWSPPLSEISFFAGMFQQDFKVLPSSQDLTDADRSTTHLLVVNPQRDFACSDGARFGQEKAVSVTETITRFIYNNVENITRITPTLTNHFPFQIMFANFWLTNRDDLPEVGEQISVKALEEGIYRPNPAMAMWLCRNEYDWLVDQVKHYCQELEKQGEKLVIQPLHCIHGSIGYSIVGVIEEARMFHSMVRTIQAECEVNGSNPLAENYSFLGPKILSNHNEEDSPVDWKNLPALASTVLTDNLVLAGHHRVADTARDILLAIGTDESNWPCRLFYLKDGVIDEESMPDKFTAIESLADIPPPEKEEDNGK